MSEEDFAEWLGIGYRNKSELREVTYYTCMKVLCETMGKLPIKVYEDMPGRGRVRAEPDDISRLLMIRPNPHITPAIFMTTLENNRNHYGNGYAWIQRNVSRAGIKTHAVWLMQSNMLPRFMIIVESSGRLARYIISIQILSMENIIYFRKMM